MEQNKKKLKDLKNKTSTQNPSVTVWDSISFIKNIIILSASILLTTLIFRENQGYNWVWKNLIHDNLAFIKSNRKISEEEKYQSKFGIDYSILNFVKENSPENAVILMPPNKILSTDTSHYTFFKGFGGLTYRYWALYFTYPRKLNYSDLSPNFKDQSTHILTMFNWGYDKLPYPVAQTQDIQVLPLAKPQ